MTWLRFEESKTEGRYYPFNGFPLPYWNIYSYGILAGKNFHHTPSQNQIIGIFQHFDYFVECRIHTLLCVHHIKFRSSQHHGYRPE